MKSIIEKRRDFEYLTTRMGREKKDYLAYIQYEIKLDQLTQQRVRRLGIRRFPSRAAGLKRIHGLFKAALGRYRSDTSLWLQVCSLLCRFSLASVSGLSTTHWRESLYRLFFWGVCKHAIKSANLCQGASIAPYSYWTLDLGRKLGIHYKPRHDQSTKYERILVHIYPQACSNVLFVLILTL